MEDIKKLTERFEDEERTASIANEKLHQTCLEILKLDVETYDGRDEFDEEQAADMGCIPYDNGNDPGYDYNTTVNAIYLDDNGDVCFDIETSYGRDEHYLATYVPNVELVEFCKNIIPNIM